ncbi:DHA2 family efflux MFS transporter permease subunit [Streptomyces sp. NPDC059002]|uniref:DHA2 family efflux MFS transporter permease subunit n=1 Tax=Streptomyces sp. NPDC059002 TaxID=3346690 RepID=UPI00369DE385
MGTAAANELPKPASDERLGKEIWVLAGVVVLGSIMAVLDTTIVNVALSTLSEDLDTGLTTLQWVVTGYFLAMGMVIPLVGWAVERFGTKPLWLLSLTLFVLGSGLSGAAWSIESLIAFRVLQGLGGGMLMPLAQTILATAAGPQRMGRVMSIIGVPMLLGPVLGPVLGGWLVGIDWRLIFYVNIPLGVLAVTAAVKWLPRTPGQQDGGSRLDTRGLALLSSGLVALLYGLSRAGAEGFGDGIALVALAAGALLVTVFAVAAGRRGADALIDVRLFANRTFGAASLTTFLFSIGLFGSMLLLPLFYQTAKGESALTAGLLLAPQGFGAALAMPVAGVLTDRLGAGRIVPAGVTLALAGTFLYTQVDPDTSYTLLAVSLMVRGFGLGATMAPALSSAYATLTKDAVPRASSTLTIVQQIGGSIGSAVLSVVLSSRINANLPAGAGGSGGGGGAGDLPDSVRERVEGPLATAFAETFWTAFGLVALIYLPAFFLPKKPLPKESPPKEPLPSPARGLDEDDRSAP